MGVDCKTFCPEIIGAKKIQAVSKNTSRANPMGFKYVINPTQGVDILQACV